MYAETKDVGTSDPRALFRHGFYHHFSGLDQCNLGLLDVGNTPVLHLDLANAVSTENRDRGGVCHWHFVSPFQIFYGQYSFLFSACITSIMRTVASFNIVGAIDLTWDLIPLAFWA